MEEERHRSALETRSNQGVFPNDSALLGATPSDQRPGSTNIF